MEQNYNGSLKTLLFIVFLLSLTGQVFDIWAVMPYRFARSVFICKCFPKLLFHGAGVSGLPVVEVCTLLSAAETGKGQMCGLHHFSSNSQNIWNVNGTGNWYLRTLGKGELNDNSCCFRLSFRQSA